MSATLVARLHAAADAAREGCGPTATLPELLDLLEWPRLKALIAAAHGEESAERLDPEQARVGVVALPGTEDVRTIGWRFREGGPRYCDDDGLLLEERRLYSRRAYLRFDQGGELVAAWEVVDDEREELR